MTKSEQKLNEILRATPKYVALFKLTRDIKSDYWGTILTVDSKLCKSLKTKESLKVLDKGDIVYLSASSYLLGSYQVVRVSDNKKAWVAPSALKFLEYWQKDLLQDYLKVRKK